MTENSLFINASVPAEFVENNTTATASGMNNVAGKMCDVFKAFTSPLLASRTSR